eukprot:6627638-Pyramimonas_sp.AAC.1
MTSAPTIGIQMDVRRVSKRDRYVVSILDKQRADDADNDVPYCRVMVWVCGCAGFGEDSQLTFMPLVAD